MANIISTIDLWLPHASNREITYDKVFRAGFDRKGISDNEAVTASYDSYHVIQNCYCELTGSITELHTRRTAIIFYRQGQPIRLLVDDLTGEEVNKYIYRAMAQRIGSLEHNSSLVALFDRLGITTTTIDMAADASIAEQSQCEMGESAEEEHPEPILSSCDRWDLLLQFINNNKREPGPCPCYTIDLGFLLICRLRAEDHNFYIWHQGALVDADRQHYIMFQKHSPIMP